MSNKVDFEFTIDSELASGLMIIFHDMLDNGPRELGVTEQEFVEIPKVVAVGALCSEGFRYLGIDQQTKLPVKMGEEGVFRHRRWEVDSMDEPARLRSKQRAVALLNKLKLVLIPNTTVVVRAVN